MTSYLIRRSIHMILLVFLAVSVVFFLLSLSGDPARLMLPADATADEVEAMRARLGLDDPLHIRYFRFIGGAMRGDFGTSFRYGEPAMPLVLQRLPATLQLVVLSTVLFMSISIAASVILATRHGSYVDTFGTTLAVFGQAMPGFWIGLMMILVFSVRLGWLPTGGYGGVVHFILPVLAMTIRPIGRFTRVGRSSMLEVLRQDYVRTARSKGLSERVVIYKHALRNALLPLITMLGLSIGVRVGGAVIVETVFYWPGTGRLLVSALNTRDFAVVLSGIFIVSVAVAIANLAADVAYVIADPRIKYE